MRVEANRCRNRKTLWGGRRGWQLRRYIKPMECRDAPAERKAARVGSFLQVGMIGCTRGSVTPRIWRDRLILSNMPPAMIRWIIYLLLHTDTVHPDHPGKYVDYAPAWTVRAYESKCWATRSLAVHR